MEKETISGKIIRIIDAKTVIINLGTADGISNSSYFNIIGKPEEIIDPFTDEILGSLEVVKAKVKASQAFEKFTIATTHYYTSKIKMPDSPTINLITNMWETVEVDEGELNVDPKEIQPWKAKSELPVKVGDIDTVEIEKEQSKDESKE